ncbi:MAG: macro domain-containing protein [Candidatus Korarchaeota archaeon]|nr:macro domain-containing protein [Candidatus Korarchaeota archaeon]
MPRIVIVRGDITEIEADAIVNPANVQMIMGGGVAGAIRRKGGEEIQQEALKKAPVRIGSAIVTGAGRLRARYVIHAPTVETPGGKSSLEFIRKAVKAAISKAEEMGLKSIAFPAMGAGVGGIPVEKSVEIILEEAIKSNLEEIVLVAWSIEDFKTFQRVAAQKGVDAITEGL